MSGGLRVRAARELPHAPERVFDAFLDPAIARRFLFATPGGEMVRVEIDARVGGEFVVVERRPAGEAAHYGTFRVLERPRRLAFDFTAEDPAGARDRITIDIVPQGAGARVTLAHEMRPEWSAYADQAQKGWASILEALERAL